MTAPRWHEGPMAALDTETTAPDPLTARIVQCAIVHHIPGSRPRTLQWIIDPGTPIPDEAAAVHGWTNERLAKRLDGREALRITAGREAPLTRDGALFEIAGQCATAIGAGIALVVHNAAFDLTLLERELVRNDIDPLSSRPAGITGVVDPMVVEKAYDPYRKVKDGCKGGKHNCCEDNPNGCCGAENKTLGNLAAHYGLPHVGAHDAAGDALAAIRLARKLASLWPEIARWKLGTLHRHQVDWRREQSDSLREFWRKQGDERWREVDSAWPLHSSLTEASGAAGTAEVGAA